MSSMASSNSAATAWLLSTATMPPRRPTASAVASVRQVLSAWTSTVGDAAERLLERDREVARGGHHLAHGVLAERVDDGHVAGRALGTLGELPGQQLHVSFSFWCQCLPRGPAAVDDQRVAGHVAGRRGREEEQRAVDLAGLAAPAEHRVAAHPARPTSRW